MIESKIERGRERARERKRERAREREMEGIETESVRVRQWGSDERDIDKKGSNGTE